MIDIKVAAAQGCPCQAPANSWSIEMLHRPDSQRWPYWAERSIVWLQAFNTRIRWQRNLSLAGEHLWRWRYRGPGLIAVLFALWYFGAAFLLGPMVNVDVVTRTEFVQSVVASGHVEAPFRVNIGSQIIGVVAEVPVAEGQTVRAGEILVVLDDHEARAAVVQAEGALAQAEARLRQMRELTLPSAEAGLRQAQATLVNAQQIYDRAAKLAKDGVGTRATLDEATKSLDVARALLRHAELQVFTSQPGGSDYVMAETQVNQTRAALDTARSRLSYTVITAPRDGILISRAVERGNVVQPANVLMALSPLGDTQLVVQVDEKNLGLIAVGQTALASADAYPKSIFAAEVVYINPGIDLQRASVEVKLRVPEPPDFLRQDMTISVDIETARRHSALVIPAVNLRGMANDRPWVLKVDHRRATRQLVKVGIASAGKAEIVDGLSPGDLVVPATTGVDVGSRLRARPFRSARGEIWRGLLGWSPARQRERASVPLRFSKSGVLFARQCSR